MSELTPKANKLLAEYQRYAVEPYEATEDEWASFGKKAVSALYETERVITTQAAELERLREVHDAALEYFVLDPDEPIDKSGAVKKSRLQEAFARVAALEGSD